MNERMVFDYRIKLLFIILSSNCLALSYLFDKEWDRTQSVFYSNGPMLAMTRTSMIEIVTLAH